MVNLEEMEKAMTENSKGNKNALIMVGFYAKKKKVIRWVVKVTKSKTKHLNFPSGMVIITLVNNP